MSVKWATALAGTVLAMALAGAAGWQLVQLWTPAGWLCLVAFVAFIAWQTWVTVRLQRLVERLEQERIFAERLAHRINRGHPTGGLR